AAAAGAKRVRAFHPGNEGSFMWVSVGWSERIGAELAGADADGLVEGDDEHLAVADLAGRGRLEDGVERGVEAVVGDRAFDLQLGQEVDDVFGAAVQLGMALLPAEAFHFGDGDAGHAYFGERFAHLVELERAD